MLNELDLKSEIWGGSVFVDPSLSLLSTINSPRTLTSDVCVKDKYFFLSNVAHQGEVFYCL